MSVFTPFRNRRVIATTFAVSGALKLATHMQPLYAQQTQAVDITTINGVTPLATICDNSSAIQSTVINITSTQLQVVGSTVSTTAVFVCGWEFMTKTSSDVVTWLQGSSTDCITGQTALSGPFDLSSRMGMVRTNAGFAQMRTSGGWSLCMETTSSNVVGMVTYRQASST